MKLYFNRIYIQIVRIWIELYKLFGHIFQRFWIKIIHKPNYLISSYFLQSYLNGRIQTTRTKWPHKPHSILVRIWLIIRILNLHNWIQWIFASISFMLFLVYLLLSVWIKILKSHLRKIRSFNDHWGTITFVYIDFQPRLIISNFDMSPIFQKSGCICHWLGFVHDNVMRWGLIDRPDKSNLIRLTGIKRFEIRSELIWERVELISTRNSKLNPPKTESAWNCNDPNWSKSDMTRIESKLIQNLINL